MCYANAMKFVKATADTGVQAVYDALRVPLEAGKNVVWLVSGGSNIPLEVEIADKLAEHFGKTLHHLTILLTDERYGAAGHINSNYKQLVDARFKLPSANFIDILGRNLSLEDAVEYYKGTVMQALETANFVLAQFGVGSDGHIAGILPHSPAATIEVDTVVGYKWRDYDRITLTYPLLIRINAAYTFAYGDGKLVALTRLQKNNEDFAALPSKLLYDIKDAYVYNDKIEEAK